jgi:hypothetical protein
MSLAEELLADLEEEGDEEMDDLDGVKKEEEDDIIDEVTEDKPLPNLSKYDQVTDVAKLTTSAQ